MIIGRFKVQCLPERADEVAAALVAVEAPSRRLPGVVHFDVVRSLTEASTLLAFEVFEDRAALDRQDAQAEVARVTALLDAGAAVGAYEWTVWETTPS